MPKGQKSKASDWLPHIEAWQQSGLTKKAFCLAQNICYKNFTKWTSASNSRCEPGRAESEGE